MRWHEFKSYPTVKSGILSQINLTHPPGPEGLEDLVGAEAGPRRQRHQAALRLNGIRRQALGGTIQYRTQQRKLKHADHPKSFTWCIS